jgi:hypothetical protein
MFVIVNTYEMIHTNFVDMFIICLYKYLHMPSSSGTLGIKSNREPNIDFWEVALPLLGFHRKFI